MSDDYKKQTGDEEYQFPKDEYVSVETGHDDTEKSDTHETEPTSYDDPMQDGRGGFKELLQRVPLFQNKRVLVVGGVAIVALVGFKIMTPSHHVRIVKKSPVAAQAQVDQNHMISQLHSLSQAASNSQNTVSQLQSQVSHLRDALNSASNNETSMRNAVIALAQQVQQLSNQVKAANAKPKKKSLYPPAPVITYHLIAVEPGRAWVMGSNGLSDTVALGSTLKHYGTIKAIEPQSGKLLTSSGKVITYNAEGN